jgi:hypothetical protein
VDLAYAIAVVVACKFPATMVDGGVRAAGRRKRIVRVPFIGHDRCARLARLHYQWFEGAAGTAEGLAYHRLSSVAPDRTEHRRPIVVKCAVTAELVRTATRWIVRIKMLSALFPGILVHLVDFDDRVRQFGGGKVVRGRGPERDAASLTSDAG